MGAASLAGHFFSQPATETTRSFRYLGAVVITLYTTCTFAKKRRCNIYGYEFTQCPRIKEFSNQGHGSLQHNQVPVNKRYMDKLSYSSTFHCPNRQFHQHVVIQS